MLISRSLAPGLFLRLGGVLARDIKAGFLRAILTGFMTGLLLDG
ncbi:hypothetical protein [Borrelia miyamotoi]|uniref:Uncharacterized protein n=1 Tax=Borrelia miyamotoi TaxID=47466 RepID=A0ABY7VLS0_9SPIR|nr:hypothetical protein [Borrelia miyamotoi]WAZ70485.1 hypothetical protein O5403_02310 [Borrelia miyamotoi]WCL22125.1 hypothetical protein CNO10_07135 [Borrelia miyamotoi]WDE71630.1 hypothetical protein CNO13_06495 [Borrelia miyamotoi]